VGQQPSSEGGDENDRYNIGPAGSYKQVRYPIPPPGRPGLTGQRSNFPFKGCARTGNRRQSSIDFVVICADHTRGRAFDFFHSRSAQGAIGQVRDYLGRTAGRKLAVGGKEQFFVRQMRFFVQHGFTVRPLALAA
jgi:hypothetical protein